MPVTPTRLQRRLKARYGPIAVVTGASEGIGRAFAQDLAAAGFDLVVVARRQTELESLATELSARHGVRALVLSADLGTADGVRRVMEQTSTLPVGLFVAAAGFGTSGGFADSPLSREVDMVAVNCRAVLEMTHGFARRFVAQRRGGIILFSSLVAFQGVPRAAHYAATKAYVQTLAEGIHHELKPFGVDVVASAPGPIHSGFAARANMRLGMGEKPAVVAHATLRGLGRRITVRPGLIGWGLQAALSLLPRWGRVRIMAMVMSGMAGKGDGIDKQTQPGET